jgi:hypothetical protein
VSIEGGVGPEDSPRMESTPEEGGLHSSAQATRGGGRGGEDDRAAVGELAMRAPGEECSIAAEAVQREAVTSGSGI